MKNKRFDVFVLVGAMAVTTIYAAPVVPGESSSDALAANAEAQGQMGAALPTTSNATATRTSRAVEMLLDMQGKSAGLDFSAGARALDKSSQPEGTAAPAKQVNASVSPETMRAQQSGLFGAGATPIPATKPGTDPASAWRSTSSTAGTSDSSETRATLRSSGVGTEWDQRVNLPRAVVAWVREHRSVVVATAIGLLALLWGGSIAMGQRRR